MTDYQNLMWLFIPLLFLVAFLYASVGHGGASGYLALMALFGFSASVMKSTSLTLNLFVSLMAFYQYKRSGYFNLKLFLPFSIASVPAAFLGSFITIDTSVYKKILGALLVFSVLRMLGVFGKGTYLQRELKFMPGIIIGALIGLLSGIIGIGGGVILSPIILLMGWGDIKQTAAVSAPFIFVNSISGLAGLFVKGPHYDNNIVWWIAIVLLGGIAGSYFASAKFNNRVLKQILSVVLLLASIKLLGLGEK